MRIQVFEDYLGRRWEVWQTNPQLAERREVVRRRLPDRRRGSRPEPPRRHLSDRREQQAARFPGVSQLEGGWLCFESEGQRKRLAPVPEAWGRADDLTLAALCNFASETIRYW